MPRYFFNTRDSELHRDTIGTELKDRSAARKHAVVFAGEVLSNEPDVLWDGREFQVEVQDETQLLLFTITCYATNAPAGGDTK